MNRYLPLEIPEVAWPTAEELQSRLLVSVVVVLAVWLLRRITVRGVETMEMDQAVRYRWRKITAYSATLLLLVLLSVIWVEQLRSITAVLALMGAGLAIALKDLVTGVAGWLFILLRHPFRIGDRIEIADHRGDVIDQRLFKFTLMEIGNWVEADQSTGRVLHLPNGLVLSQPILNYTRDFPYIWNEVTVTVTFESDWRRAKVLMLEAAQEATMEFVKQAEEDLRRATHSYLLHFSRLTPIVYSKLVEQGVRLTIRHLCPPRQRRSVTEAVSEAILDRFAGAPGVEFAYPTRRFFDRTQEGRSAPPEATDTEGTEAEGS